MALKILKKLSELRKEKFKNKILERIKKRKQVSDDFWNI